ncbi:hypothetical protein [Acholeplasma equifetale]|uniref:hypothetical protein n=1 Tax=Acholeplasma equifetale TaxID=264634 RepID=UPI0004794CF8|nr:hypothetical protein [Acholeplasma equifetale]
MDQKKRDILFMISIVNVTLLFIINIIGLVAINLTDIIHNEYLQALAEIPMLMSLSLGIVTLSNAHKIKRNEEKELSYSILKILTSVLSIIFLMLVSSGILLKGLQQIHDFTFIDIEQFILSLVILIPNAYMIYLVMNIKQHLIEMRKMIENSIKEKEASSED